MTDRSAEDLFVEGWHKALRQESATIESDLGLLIRAGVPIQEMRLEYQGNITRLCRGKHIVREYSKVFTYKDDVK